MLSELHFHPSIVSWFNKNYESPTQVQLESWESIKTHKNTLIAAPTGSGKTLAAFLSAINDLIIQGINGRLNVGTQIIYVSPLKALSNDIEKNLREPLSGIKEELELMGIYSPEITVMVRTGDTPQYERIQMIKSPPHILITTPESLYLLLTSKNGRKLLSPVHTVIIDEIHAMVGDKRGSHLSLSLERLNILANNGLKRIGLSATQKPIEKVAQFLTGNTDDEYENCKIINTGHSRNLDLSIEIPKSPLSSVMANEVWGEIYERIIELINSHKTTLIFVNTRKLAERLSHKLSEQMGPGAVLGHHGSMSKERRLEAEQKLKSGNLKCLVATASMELGIDVGSIDLVIQISSPRSIAAFLQRVGRSGHSVKKTPKGILFPLTLDELIECAAIMDAIRRKELDQIIMPDKPLDIMAQQIIAEASCNEYQEDELYNLIKKAYPYQNLTRKEFDEVITMLSEGYATRRGRSGAYLYYDEINGKIKARKGAQLTAITSGGAIPDTFDYDVILEPDGVFLGTLNEDYAIESTPGDIFQLGNNSWRVLRVETGKVRVSDAEGLPPHIPFWLGEAPGRTAELSQAVSRLREKVSELIGNLDDVLFNNEEEKIDHRWAEPAIHWLENDVQINKDAAEQIVNYLATGKAALKIMPSQNNLVLERFFDEAGDMHLVIHSPFGSRLNKAWGLSLRKRFCRKFNFELQAAASDDAIILSLGSTHSFPLEEVFDYLNPETVREILIQAMLDAPVFGIRWRWNASRALAILRRRGNKKVPPQIQRMQSEDLVAQVFPDQLACLENIAGDREVPDHPLVNETIKDCLYEAMDIEGLEDLLKKIRNKELNLYTFDLKEPSPFANGIINARPYAFLDDAPLEERRTLAVKSRRWLSPNEAKELGQLDQEAIDSVKKEAFPEVDSPDELHDALLLSGFITENEGENYKWTSLLQSLINENRATAIKLPTGNKLWIAGERIPYFEKIFNSLELVYPISLPEKIRLKIDNIQDPLTEIVRGRAEIMGPFTSKELSDISEVPIERIHLSLIHLENEGFIFRGKFSPNTDLEEWCERRLLARIHRYTLQRLRNEIKPVSVVKFMHFLFSWHHVLPDKKKSGPEALLQTLTQLEGFHAPSTSWEGDILPSRIKDYDHNWLDILCISGKLMWGRFKSSVKSSIDKSLTQTIKTTPISFISRTNLPIWQYAYSNSTDEDYPISNNSKIVDQIIKQNGALFFDDIVKKSGLFEYQVEECLNELISINKVTSDSFTGLRALLTSNKYKAQRNSNTNLFSMKFAGRWSLIQTDEELQKRESVVERIAWILLHRYGIVFRKLVERENISIPWRDLVRTYRTLEARGLIRGGRFVEGFYGEQFALPEAIVELRKINKEPEQNVLVSISAADPLNLTGIIIPGKRIPGYWGNRILFRDGKPIATLESKDINFLENVDTKEKWTLQNVLIQRNSPPKLRKYLGKNV